MLLLQHQLFRPHSRDCFYYPTEIHFPDCFRGVDTPRGAKSVRRCDYHSFWSLSLRDQILLDATFEALMHFLISLGPNLGQEILVPIPVEQELCAVLAGIHCRRTYVGHSPSATIQFLNDHNVRVAGMIYAVFSCRKMDASSDKCEGDFRTKKCIGSRGRLRSNGALGSTLVLASASVFAERARPTRMVMLCMTAAIRTQTLRTDPAEAAPETRDEDWMRVRVKAASGAE